MSPDAILVDAHGRIVFANSAARRMFAESADQPLGELTLAQLGLMSDVTRIIEEPSAHIDTVATRLDGSRFEVALRCMPMIYEGKDAIQVVARDISDRKRLEQQLAYQATHDALTGVSNRSALLAQPDDPLA